MNLYQIEQQYINLASQLEQGEVTQEMEMQLLINENDLKNKAVNYCFVIKQQEVDIDCIDVEIQRLTNIKKAKINAAERLKQAVSSAMQLYCMDKIETPLIKLSFRTSQSVEIINENQLLPEFLNTKQVTTVNKIAIKKALDEGRDIEGAVIVVKQNLQFK